MSQVLSEKQQEVLLDMLKTVHWFCEENGIRYFLAFETLLGAVRNKGLLSWQTHLNIVMPRNDYERFIGTFETLKQYRLRMFLKDNTYHYPYAEIVFDTSLNEDWVELKNAGVYLAVIPLDNLSDNLEVAEKLIENVEKKKKKLKRNLILWEHLASSRKVNAGKSYLNQKLKRITNSIDKECKSFRSNEFSEYIGAIAADRTGWNEILKPEWYSESITVAFEYIEACIPIGFDEILKQLYVNYENMPL